MLRVIGGPCDSATRIENRIGEPAANPYLYMASQIYAGMDGIRACMQAPKATNSPYATEEARLPGSLGKALEMLNKDQNFCESFGIDFIRYFNRVKASEVARHDLAEDKDEWQRREYFSRI